MINEERIKRQCEARGFKVHFAVGVIFINSGKANWSLPGADDRDVLQTARELDAGDRGDVGDVSGSERHHVVYGGDAAVDVCFGSDDAVEQRDECGGADQDDGGDAGGCGAGVHHAVGADGDLRPDGALGDRETDEAITYAGGAGVVLGDGAAGGGGAAAGKDGITPLSH